MYGVHEMIFNVLKIFQHLLQDFLTCVWSFRGQQVLQGYLQIKY